MEPGKQFRGIKAPKGYCNLCGITRELARSVPGQSVCKSCQDRLVKKAADGY